MARAAGRSAVLVAAGILVSRVVGFIRERVFAYYFGNSAAADAVRAALKIPNVIRNLLGEGTLSASFIPVYARLLESDDPRAARALAGAVAAILLAATAVAALLGLAFAPAITAAVAPGFDPATRRLTVTLVRILFPMSGLLILAGWCLGVLNSHRRFFLPYAAPTLWSVTQIAVLIALGGTVAGGSLAVWLAWGILGGALLQLAVQVPSAIRLVGGLELRFSLQVQGVNQVLRAWTPVVIGAGIVQISSLVDMQLASLLGSGAVASLGYAQLLTNLPIALFGVSVAAASLPELSRDAAGAAGADALRGRVSDGIRRIVFFVLPCAFAFAALGEPMVGALFETGRFDRDDTALVTGVLAAYSIGLVAYATVKLFASAFYALGDTRTPVKIGAASVVLSAALAFVLMRRFGPAGVALGSAIAATVNALAHLWRLERRIGAVFGRDDGRALALVLAASGLGTACGWVVFRLAAPVGLIGAAALAYLALGLVFLATARAAAHPDAARLVRGLASRGRR